MKIYAEYDSSTNRILGICLNTEYQKKLMNSDPSAERMFEVITSRPINKSEYLNLLEESEALPTVTTDVVDGQRSFICKFQNLSKSKKVEDQNNYKLFSIFKGFYETIYKNKL